MLLTPLSEAFIDAASLETRIAYEQVAKVLAVDPYPTEGSDLIRRIRFRGIECFSFISPRFPHALRYKVFAVTDRRGRPIRGVVSVTIIPETHSMGRRFPG